MGNWALDILLKTFWEPICHSNFLNILLCKQFDFCESTYHMEIFIHLCKLMHYRLFIYSHKTIGDGLNYDIPIH